MAAESFSITKLEANQMGPIVQVGVSSEAVKQVGHELRELIRTLNGAGSCEAVQELAVKAFIKACSADNATIRDCTFNIGQPPRCPTPFPSQEEKKPDPTPVAPIHGCGQY